MLIYKLLEQIKTGNVLHTQTPDNQQYKFNFSQNHKQV